jgi:hypothetical protein
LGLDPSSVAAAVGGGGEGATDAALFLVGKADRSDGIVREGKELWIVLSCATDKSVDEPGKLLLFLVVLSMCSANLDTRETINKNLVMRGT